MVAFAGTEFATPAGTTSYFTPCFPLYATASDGAGTLTGMSGTDANFVISIHDDDASTETEFQTTADIETISTIGTYAAPTADTDIRFGECATAGTYQLQFRDTFLADNGTNMLTVKLTDGVDTMGDQIVYINLNVAALADIGTEVRDTPCGTPTADTFGGQVCTEIDAANAAISELNIDLGEPVGADFSADIAAIEAQTDDIGVAGVGLTEAGGTGDQYTAIPYNSAWNADIESEASDALTAFGAATAAALSTHDGKLDTADANIDLVLADTNELQVDDYPARFTGVEGATFATGTDSLEAIRNRGDAEWVTGAGGSAPTVEQIRTEMDSNSTQLTAIVADTDELQSDDLPGLIAALNDPTAAAIAAAVMAETCEDQGGGVTVQECLSILLAEAAGTAVYTSGSRTWAVSDPSGNETRMTIVYGTELDGDRTSSSLTPVTP